MIDRKALLADLKKQVTSLEKDLSQQVRALPEINSRLRAEYDQARKLGRTATTWNSWLDERITQVAVAWVLGTVFVRFCEDNRLIPEPYLAAPGADRHDLSRARYEAYVEEDDDPTYRGWLERAFAELGKGQAGKLLFDPVHNPLFQIPISHDAAGALITFWKTREDGSLVHDFTDPLNDDGTEGWDTRFLGDLYQDLSDSARATYALLQTPEFVEEFILDRTMDPAIREFGYEELKMIDPTCGSGHFVLGAFRRLVRLWNERQPGRDLAERVHAALDSVHGVDINPFAIAVARFRLMVAAMAVADIRTLAQAAKYEWPIHLAIGDSLLKERQLEFGLVGESIGDLLAGFSYATEDIHEHPGILEAGRYHVVVGNPPYITVRDKNINMLYRALYSVCSGTYALTVPFAQRFFELAKQGTSDTGEYGLVGQITSNSFMKREFGTRLIEDYFAHRVELTEVIDSSGAYIPGHGTPTVILVGTRRSGSSRSSTVRTVRSIQGEPAAPKHGDTGLVWAAIVGQIDQPGSESQWVSCADLERERYFSKQPWILVDNGLEMTELLSRASGKKLKEAIAPPIGRAIRTGADEAYVRPGEGKYRSFESAFIRPLVTGDVVREWSVTPKSLILFPSLEEGKKGVLQTVLWPLRRLLQARRTFQGDMADAGLAWWDYMQFTPSAYSTPLFITFAEVATHNHFALIQGKFIFKQTAPVIKLPQKAERADHVKLVGLLNSSTACFWLRMMCHNKGSTVDVKGARQSGIPFDDFYQFNGSNVERYPLPVEYPDRLPNLLDICSQKISTSGPVEVVAAATPTASALQGARLVWESLRARMIALQEELDWQVYSIYDLHPEDLRAPEDDVPELALGERAFEIVLARRVANGEASGEWFKRHGSTPITVIPSHWPESYKQIVQRRIDAIETSRAIGMIERPEYKRRWATEGWDALQEKALQSWLLDRIEKREHWFDANDMPVLVSLSRLIDMLSRDDDFVSVAKLYRPRDEFAKVVADLMADEHVPFLPQLRYKPSGLRKRSDWEHVWDLQRQEDAAEGEMAKRKIRDSIPTPPKYASADFLKPSYWRARGKLDVPKERFISYLTALGVQPKLFGWAGWDHREQAQALATYFTNQALTREEITPFLAGLLELQPWLKQWHDDIHPLYGGSPAAFFNGYRQQISGEHDLTDDDLRAWRPDPPARGRRAAK
ncbi:BREX-2 system adenine-specific DNA-methyltransferase PglX [Actinomadura nitritigenes]|uniref:BREX-2 system adenine-specific DNA-methyltransferase PglX n=1 Tax=Actinomadura nitritigenes TaxID=134602 RepID=UPI0027DCA5B1|nr:BREX-2 system adenine-specific DNA-methyltransferase PglX [Actinomadura nitritigenes]